MLVLGCVVHAALAAWFEQLCDGASESTCDELIAITVASIEEARCGAVPIAANDNDEDLNAEAAPCVRRVDAPVEARRRGWASVSDGGAASSVIGERYELEGDTAKTSTKSSART